MLPQFPRFPRCCPICRPYELLRNRDDCQTILIFSCCEYRWLVIIVFTQPCCFCKRFSGCMKYFGIFWLYVRRKTDIICAHHQNLFNCYDRLCRFHWPWDCISISSSNTPKIVLTLNNLQSLSLLIRYCIRLTPETEYIYNPLILLPDGNLHDIILKIKCFSNVSENPDIRIRCETIPGYSDNDGSSSGHASPPPITPCDVGTYYDDWITFDLFLSITTLYVIQLVRFAYL